MVCDLIGQQAHVLCEIYLIAKVVKGNAVVPAGVPLVDTILTVLVVASLHGSIATSDDQRLQFGINT